MVFSGYRCPRQASILVQLSRHRPPVRPGRETVENLSPGSCESRLLSGKFQDAAQTFELEDVREDGRRVSFPWSQFECRSTPLRD